MTTQYTEIQSVLGFDISCDSVTLFDSLTGHTTIHANDGETLRAALMPLQARHNMLAICEATGGYEDTLLATLVSLGIPAHRADAAKVKAYIRSFGNRAKTDAIDARFLARYGLDRASKLARWQTVDTTQESLQILVARRSDLVAMRVQEKNRLKAPRSRLIAEDIKSHIAELDRRIEAIEKTIETLIKRSRTLTARQTILRSVPGIGPTVACLVLATMPELGHINRRQAASLAGCAPHPKDSGKAVKYRSTAGGRRQIRPALFVAALAAIRGDNALAGTYRALVKAGKPKRIAIVAVMRKIITIANARIRETISQLT